MTAHINTPELSRRGFLSASAAVAIAAPALARPGHVHEPGRLRLGLIGCGGRGTGAAADMLSAAPDVRLVAMADVFPDRLAGSHQHLAGEPDFAGRIEVPAERRFTGFDAYKRLLAEVPIDVAILATPPGFRPIHFAAAVDAGCHIFMEKPVAVCPAGVRMVIEAARRAAAKNLTIVAGTQRRHERSYLQTIARATEPGLLGDIVAARCFWNQGGLWMHRRQPQWTDVEWQLRNWLYFDWLSGDHIVEQHVHNLDVVNWVLGRTPARATAMGGREVRTDPAYGHIYDHFAVDFEYPGIDGRPPVYVLSMCRQIDGCASGVYEQFTGTRGVCRLWPGGGIIEPQHPGDFARFEFSGDNPSPYVEEHKALIASISGRGEHLNDGERIAHSTLTAIMGRMSAYTGKSITWDQAMTSGLSLLPPEDLTLGPLATPPVAVPGKTTLQ